MLVLTNFRTAVFHAVPAQLKVAISVGIGLFIALIGLVDAGWVRQPRLHGHHGPVGFGLDGTLQGWPVLVFAIGLVLVVTLYVRQVKGAILISIMATVIAVIVESIANIGPTVQEDGSVNPTGWNLNVPAWPDQIVDLPDFSLLGEFSLFGSSSGSAW